MATGSDLLDGLPEKEDGYFEPNKHERVWFRHTVTGDRGYLVRRGGEQRIRYDRPQEDLHVPKNARWKPDDEDAPFSLFQVSQVAFEADKKLCFLLGRHGDSRREWQSLTEEGRWDWMTKGPDDDPLRVELFAGIMAVMRRHAK